MFSRAGLQFCADERRRAQTFVLRGKSTCDTLLTMLRPRLSRPSRGLREVEFSS